MPVSGTINVEFMKYILYGEVMGLSPKFDLYWETIGGGPVGGSYTFVKSLPATCNPIDVSGGVGISCTASDTSTDEYHINHIALVRSVTGLPSGSPEKVMVYVHDIYKSSDQRLDIELRAQLTA